MRLGVLDVGSNTVHLLVVDAHPGAHPWPAHSEKSLLRLAEQIGPDGALTEAGADALVAAVAAARAAANQWQTSELIAFATSAVRDATNSAQVLARVRAETGVHLQVLSGADEARMTFLAVRRWFGWSAGRLTRERLGLTPLTTSPPSAQFVTELREYVDAQLQPLIPKLQAQGWDRAVGSSKTFRTLARLAGAAPSGAGLWAQRQLTRTGLRQVTGFIRHIPPAELHELEGVRAGSESGHPAQDDALP